MSKVLILDSETTGVGKTDQIIELAYAELQPVPIFKQTMWHKKDTVHNQRYMPSVPIHPAASKVHGITYKELLGKPKSETIEFPKDVEYMIGHQISFDHRMLGKPDVKLICTMNLCKNIVKFTDITFPNVKLDTLVDVLCPTHIKGTTHSALGDIMKNCAVLEELLKLLPNITSWDELYSLQQSMKKK